MDSAEGDYPGNDPGSAAKIEDNSLGRLLALSDGVFAIAMTLLALDLRLPELGEDATPARVTQALASEWPSVLTYLLSFYVVASYWLTHHRLMRSVTATHPRLLAHTIMLLLLVAALPFPSSLLAGYASAPISLVVYGGVNVVASVVLLWLRHDVESYGLSTAPADPVGWARSGWELRGNLVVFVLCMPAGYLFGDWGALTLALLAVSGRLPRFLVRPDQVAPSRG